MGKGGFGHMVTIRWEPLAYLLKNGLEDLSYECWEAVEKPRSDLPYNPDWADYQRLEDADDLRFAAMRENDDLIGYASILIATGLQHAGIKTASFRDIYVTPDKRGHAAKLERFVERQMCVLGVNRLTISEPLAFERERCVGKFYEFMGFVPQECIWTKRIGERTH